MITETYEQGPALDKNIYDRKVPGISNGELVGALVKDQNRPKGQPNVNEYFSKISPEIYQHHQNAMQGQMLSESRNQGTPIELEGSFEQIEEEEQLRSIKRKISSLNATVREYHTKELSRHGQVLEGIDTLQSSLAIRTWIMVAFGTIILALIILLLCMMTKVFSFQKKFGKDVADDEKLFSESLNK